MVMVVIEEHKTLAKVILAKKELAARTLAQMDYTEYCFYVHGGRWKKTRVGVFITQEVQRFIETPTDAPYEILILSMPPQHGKSMSITETLPSWYLGKNPYKRVIELSYNQVFSRSFGRKNKRKILEFGEGIFGITLAATPKSDEEFHLQNGIGGMISRGILTGVTGNPCDLMIIDDPVKNRKEADSETYRNGLFEEWINSFKTRLQAGAKVILIQTRWHEDDLAGRIRRTEEHVKMINIPCEAMENDPLGRKEGEALCPEIGKGNDWMKSFQKSYQTEQGARAWNALFQGMPTSKEGSLIKSYWFCYYDVLPRMDYLIMTVDATFKSGDDSDFVAIELWGKSRVGCFLIDIIKEKMGFGDTILAIMAMRGKYPGVNGIYIEDKANGSAIIEVLQKKILGVTPYNPGRDSKVSRVVAVSPMIEGGQVFLPKYASFTGGFVTECCQFPNGVNDDQVDGMSMALNILRKMSVLFEENRDGQDGIEDFLSFGG